MPSGAPGGARRFGTFGGVFTPCTLTILGVIMFLRLGYVVGGAGLWLALLIILISSINGKDIKVSEIVNNLMKTFNNDIARICTASIEELSHVEGIRFEEACQIQGAFELGYRIKSYRRGNHPFITSTEDVVRLTLDMIFLPEE